MTKIAFYSDSFGWGHATRDVAFLREWAKENPEDEIYWRVGRKIVGVCRELSAGFDNIRVGAIEDGISFAARGVGIDVEKSKTEVLNWFSKTKDIEREEAEFLRAKKVDLVFSDIRPEAFFAAQLADIPVFAVSNFSWALICKKNWEKMRDVHKYLDSAYALADISFVLPLCEPCDEMANKIESPFLVREINNLVSTRESKSGKKRAIISFGKSVEMQEVDIPKNVQKIEFPKSDTESQNYVAGADFVVSKASYGICSEAVGAKVPCILSARDGFEESKYVLDYMIQHGWGVEGEQIDFSLLEQKREWRDADFGFYEFALGKIERYIGRK